MIAGMAPADLRARAEEVAGILKVLSHPNRLLIACDLMEGERSVGEIEARTGVRQPTLSRELARLRDESLVETRRDSKQIFYRLVDPRIPRLIEALCRTFEPGVPRPAAAPSHEREAIPPERPRPTAPEGGAAFGTVAGRTGRFRLKAGPVEGR